MNKEMIVSGATMVFGVVMFIASITFYSWIFTLLKLEITDGAGFFMLVIVIVTTTGSVQMFKGLFTDKVEK